MGLDITNIYSLKCVNPTNVLAYPVMHAPCKGVNICACGGVPFWMYTNDVVLQVFPILHAYCH